MIVQLFRTFPCSLLKLGFRLSLAVPSRKVIIWSNYVSTIRTLIERYSGHGIVAIYGEVPNEDRQDIAARFQNDPAPRILIANPAAAGTGFTLTAAAYTIYETLSWRYDHYAQSQDRNHRIGQSMQVTYFRLLAANTVEEAIITALERKTAMARNLLSDESSTTSVAQLSREEMCDLLLHNKLPECRPDAA